MHSGSSPLRNVGVRSGRVISGMEGLAKGDPLMLGWLNGRLIDTPTQLLFANPFSHVKSNNCASSFFQEFEALFTSNPMDI